MRGSCNSFHNDRFLLEHFNRLWPRQFSVTNNIMSEFDCSSYRRRELWVV